MEYFISDLHFGHEYIYNLCKRPFTSVQEMECKLIKNWNEVVSDKDIVYIVGDFAHNDAQNVDKVLDKLHGKKHLILGNNDGWYNKSFRKYFQSVSKRKEILSDGKLIVMTHFPMLKWKQSKEGSVHVFGHIHNINAQVMEQLQNYNSFNANVEFNQYTPVTLNKLVDTKKIYKAYKQTL